jgi:hypothetical protein
MKKLTIEEKIVKLFDNHIFEKTFIQIRDNMIKLLQKTMDEDEFESIMNFIIKEYKLEIFIESWIKEYQELYTEEEIDFMLIQQESPIWKSIASKSGTIAIKLNEASKKIGHELLKKYEAEKENY